MAVGNGCIHCFCHRGKAKCFRQNCPPPPMGCQLLPTADSCQSSIYNCSEFSHPWVQWEHISAQLDEHRIVVEANFLAPIHALRFDASLMSELYITLHVHKWLIDCLQQSRPNTRSLSCGRTQRCTARGNEDLAMCRRTVSFGTLRTWLGKRWEWPPPPVCSVDVPGIVCCACRFAATSRSLAQVATNTVWAPSSIAPSSNATLIRCSISPTDGCFALPVSTT